jgi:hypothetical protein
VDEPSVSRAIPYPAPAAATAPPTIPPSIPRLLVRPRGFALVSGFESTRALGSAALGAPVPVAAAGWGFGVSSDM